MISKVLLDTNVVLDLLLDREPHVEASAEIIAKIERGELRGWLGAPTVTTLHYLVGKSLGRGKAAEHIETLLDLFNVAAVTRVVLTDAISDDIEDYEDSVLHQAAMHAGLDAIVTRNKKDFRNCGIPVYTPEELAIAI